MSSPHTFQEVLPFGTELLTETGTEARLGVLACIKAEDTQMDDDQPIGPDKHPDDIPIPTPPQWPYPPFPIPKGPKPQDGLRY